MATQRSLQKQQTRQRIVDAAWDFFRGRKVAETTLAELAKSAGVASGTIFLHFKTKADLVDYLISELNTKLRVAMKATLERSNAATHLELTRELARTFLAEWRSGAPYLDLYIDRLQRTASEKLVRVGTNHGVPEGLGQHLEAVREVLLITHDPLVLAETLNLLWRDFAFVALARPEAQDEASADLLAQASHATLERLAPGLPALPVEIVKAGLLMVMSG